MATAVQGELGDQFWWRAKVGEPVHQKVVAYGRMLQGLYRPAHQIDRVLERIYDGSRLRQFGAAMQALDRAGINAARLNVTKSVVNTVVSRLSKSRPMPSFVVDDADWSLKRKAKQYRKFILGEMLSTDFDQRSKEALRDGSIIGTGLTRIDDSGDGERVFAERMLREEFLYDPRETKYGKPQNAMHVHRIARAHLAELFPKYYSEIYAAASSQSKAADEQEDSEVTKAQSLDDYVDVFEPWHLPMPGGRGDDGRHAYCIDTCTLKSEGWDEPRFPVAMFRYAKPQRGIWGIGLVKELADIQQRINCIVRDMQMNIAAAGRGFFEVNEANDVPVEMLSGWQPFKMKYKGGTPPKFTVPQLFNQSQLQALQFFMQQAFELPGVSQAAATSKSALGAGASGVALDTQYDIDSERFAVEESNYADYRLEGAQLFVDASKRVAKARANAKGDKRKPYMSGWIHRDAIERLDHDKVSLASDEYKLQIEPVNFIPSTRAGKLSAVGQLSQAGIIPQWLAAALFDEPDLARANRINLAAFFNCERKMEELADPELGAPIPEPYNDLELEKKMAIAYYNNAQAEKAPPEVEDRYRVYIDLVEDALKKKRQGDAIAAGPAPGAMPPGVVPPQGATVPAMSGGSAPMPVAAAPMAA